MDIRLKDLRSLFDSASDLIQVTALDGTLIYTNPSWRQALGYDAAPIAPHSFLAVLHPDDRDRYQEHCFALQGKENNGTLRWTLLTSNGAAIAVEGQTCCCIDQAESTQFWSLWRLAERSVEQRSVEEHYSQTIHATSATDTDITDRKRTEILLELQNRILAKIASGEALAEILEALMGAIEAQLEGAISSILLLDEANKLRPTAAPSLPEAYSRAVDGVAISEGVGSCGTAIVRRASVITADIATDPLWQDCKTLALEHGLRACWSVPMITKDGKALGTFAVYFSTVRSPHPAELAIITHAANMARIAIERDQTETARQRNEADLQFQAAILSQIHDAVIVTDPAGTITHWNRGAEQMYGYNAAEAIGQPIAILYFPEDEALIPMAVLHLLYKHGQWDMEVPNRHQAGHRIYIHLRLSLFKDANGTVLGRIGCSNDITKRKQADRQLKQLNQALETQVKARTAQLRASEERFRSLYEQSPLGISIASLDGRLLQVNNQLCQMTGYSAAELLNHVSFDIIHPEDRPAAVELFQRLASGQQEQGVSEQRYITKAGGTVWVQMIRAMIRNDQGQPVAMVGMVQSIGERKRLEADRKVTEAALRESETRFRSLVQNVNVGIVVHDAQTNVLLHNSKALDLLGLNEDQLHGKAALDPEWQILHEDGSPCPVAAYPVPQVIATRQAVRNVVLGVHRPHTGLIPERYPDDTVWLLLNADPQLGGDGIVQQVIVSFADITYRKRLETEVLKALEKEKELNEMKSHFVSTVSHEFRTPLAVIQSASELLEHYEWDVDEQGAYFSQIYTAIEQMTHLMEDVLLISRLEADVTELKLHPIALPEFCQSLLAELQLVYGNDYPFSFTVYGKPTPVALDQKLLKQMLTNLLSNAVKYSPKHSNVHMNLSYHPNQVRLQVKDQGIGIPEADQTTLFEAFRRASNAGTIQGTGLGLAIVKRCVDLHQGQISLESQVGIGSTFTITLPTP